MNTSLRLRLALVSAVSIFTALSIAGILLMYLFERHVTRRVDQELAAYTKQLAALLTFDKAGEMTLKNALADPRFDRPFSGLYWQLEEPGGGVLRSRSLWDQSLDVPGADDSAAVVRRMEIPGPDDMPLIVRAQQVFVETAQGDRAIQLVAAVAKQEVLSARSAFSRDLMMALGLLGTVLLLASWFQIVIGLRPLNEVRERLNAIRTGIASRLEGEHPGEVQGLVREMNELLEARDRSVDRARGSAADLAHGLKTPLALLQAESRTLREEKQARPADEIDAQVEQMLQQFERHLVIARLRGTGGGTGGHTVVAVALGKVVKAMSAMPRGEEIDWRVDVPDGFSVAIDQHDFLEVFGNLFDNARKWARETVMVEGSVDSDWHTITVTDDGPGVPEEKITAMMARGGRLDERKAGSGLGLGIARDVLAAYGAKLEIEGAPGRGLRVVVKVPVSGSQTR
ncbi:MAG: ATP-binding protein [Hyphomicrobiaceae bacterium]